jgi:hypothetical protein
LERGSVRVTEIVATPRRVEGPLRISASTRTIVRDAGSWLADGFDRDVRHIQVSGTQHNDGIYEVSAIDGNTITAALGTRLNDESPTARKYGLDIFGQLVLNQPQLYVAFSRAFRDDLYGPHALGGRLAYEVGIGNSIIALKSRAEGACNTNAKEDPAACLQALREFAGSELAKASIKAGTRLAIFGEFQQLGSYSKNLAELTAPVSFGTGTSWAAGIDMGRLIAVQDDGTASVRIDVSGRYEHPANAIVGNERGVFSITLTKKFGDMSIPFGLVYATKPEFLKGVDHVLGAHVGLKFNLFPGVK